MPDAEINSPADAAARAVLGLAWSAHRIAMDIVHVSDSPAPVSIDAAAGSVAASLTLAENTLNAVPGAADTYAARYARGILADAADMLNPRNVRLLAIAHNATESCGISTSPEERCALADIAYEARDLVRNPRGWHMTADAMHARIMRRARAYGLTA